MSRNQPVRTERYTRLLGALCSCQGLAVVSNQNDIIKLFEVYTQFCALIRVRNGEGWVQYDDTDEWVTLEDLKHESKLRDNCRFFKFFLSYLELVSLLCLERNFHGIQFFSPQMPHQMLLKFIVNDRIPYQLRGKFVQIMQRIYIEDLEPLNIPNLTRVWNAVRDDGAAEVEFPNKAQSLPPEVESTKQFVRDYLNKQEGIQKCFEVEKNDLTFEVLKLTESLLGHGCYMNVDEVVDMVDPLITLLDGSTDSTSFEDDTIRKSSHQSQRAFNFNSSRRMKQKKLKERYELNEQNFRVMQCKSKMCDILFKVLDLQNDMRISKFLIRYKSRTLPLQHEMESSSRQELLSAHRSSSRRARRDRRDKRVSHAADDTNLVK